MAVEVLDAEKRRVVQVQIPIVTNGDFYLAGGTGLALRLKHRTSRDLDWFTPRSFDAGELTAQLNSIPDSPSRLHVQDPHAVRAYYGLLETSFIRYSQVVAKVSFVSVGKTQVPVANLETLAVMKAAAVHDRGTKRDFVDIHALCSTPGWSMGRFVDVATSQLPLQPMQLKLALTYFNDAERQPMPNGCKTSWESIKRSISSSVQRLGAQRSRGMSR